MKTQPSIEIYKKVYQLHLINCMLEDDSNTITEQELIDYVNNHIDEEDKIWYGFYPNK